MHHWAVAPIASTFISGHTNQGSSVSPNSTLSLVSISGGARQRQEDPLQSRRRWPHLHQAPSGDHVDIMYELRSKLSL
jgi:hypothetical protein